MSDALTVTHHGVEIEYREESNRWYFELGGKEKSAESLAKARARIDSEPKEKKAPVEKFKAYQVRGHGETPSVVEVGAQAEKKSWRGEADFWVTANGKREKVTRSSLFKITEANNATFTKIQRLDAEGQKIDKQIGELRKSLELIDLREGE